jgi:DNA-binding response OmpR family regulator
MASRPIVLVVEDDPSVRELVDFHLARSGFTVVQAADAATAFELVERSDAVVLDWMLPGMSGIEWLRRLRTGGSAAKPVLMLTARASEIDRVEGLESGADDYLVKPFSAAELVARVRSLLRRVRPPARLTVGALVIDLEGATATLDGASVPLTRREFELLAHLAATPGRVFSRSELLDRVWGEDFVGTERTVDQHVAQLRARIGAPHIETVRGRGYRLVDPVTS